MSKSIILDFGSGNLQQGFTVKVQIFNDDNQMIHCSSCLDIAANDELDETYLAWKNLLYHNDFGVNRTMRAKGGATRVIKSTDFNDISDRFKEQINNWLGSNPQLEQCISKYLNRDEEARIIINSVDRQIQKLPWHLWHLLDHDNFFKAEIAFSPNEVRQITPLSSCKSKINILTILGDDTGINLQKDLNVLKKLPSTNVVPLVKPKIADISEQLWSKPWDILFFSGHSQTLDGKGIIHINDTESLTLEQLKNGLRTAIDNGLQLAIFNSCDGLGLAQELISLHIPQLIVMREPVPDLVAQKFARYFLEDLSKGISFYQAFRKTRERLQEEFQDTCPYAGWLPIAFQNPTQKVFSWNAADSPEDNSSSLDKTRRKGENNPFGGKNKNAIAFVLLILLFTAGTLVLSPRITFLCGILSNCSKSTEYVRAYKKIVKESQDIQLLAEQPRNLKVLQNSRDALTQAIVDLRTIPNDAKIYSQVQDKLENYQKTLKQINERVEKEERAEELFRATEKNIVYLNKLTKEAQNKKDYQKLLPQWAIVKRKLESISPDVLITEEVQMRLVESNNKIESIEKAIKPLW